MSRIAAVAAAIALSLAALDARTAATPSAQLVPAAPIELPELRPDV